MASFTFTVIPDDKGVESFEVKAGMRDLRMWEKTNRGRSLGQLSDQKTLTASAMIEIAHAACRRQGLVAESVSLETFLAMYDIEAEEGEDTEHVEREATIDLDVLVAKLVTEKGMRTIDAEIAAQAVADVLGIEDDESEEAGDPLSTPPVA